MKSYRIEYTKNAKRKKHKKYVIPKSSNLLFLFNIIKGLFILYSVASSLYFLAFNRSEIGFKCDVAVWVFFVIDFVLQFFIETEDKAGHSIKHLGIILKLYSTRWMVFDILTLFPYGWLDNPNLEFSFRLLRIFKLNFLFNLVNIEVISKIVAAFISTTDSSRKKEVVFICMHMWDLINQISIMIFITYFLACMWHYYSDFIVRKLDPDPDFISFFKMNDDNNLTRMIKTWYFIFSTLTTAGFGDFYSTNTYEMIFNVVILVAGPSWFAFTTSKAFKSMNSLYNLAKNSNKQGELAKWISGIEMKHNRIPSKLKRKLNNFFIYFWKNDRLGSLSRNLPETSSLAEILEIQDETLSSLPESLRHSIFDFLCGDLFHKFSFFFGRDSSWKYNFSLYLQPRVFPKTTKLVKLDEPIHELLFVTSGRFDIKAVVQKSLTLVRTEQAYWIVGDYFIIKDLKAFFQYSAVDVIHAFAVPSFVFLNLCKVASEAFKKYKEVLVRNFEEFHLKVFACEVDEGRSAQGEERQRKRYGVGGLPERGLEGVAARLGRFWSVEGRRLKDGLSSIALRRCLKGSGIV